MFTEERREAVIRKLNLEGKVRVRELSEEFQVTEDCIRKDLKALENAGRLKRTYGGAILSQDYPLERDVVDRRKVNVEKKAVIAAKAVELIRENETIFLDHFYHQHPYCGASGEEETPGGGGQQHD